MIQSGDAIFPFTGNDVYGREVNIKEYYGQNVLLTFLRDSACPFCNLRIHNLVQALSDNMGVDFTVIAVFSSPKEEILQYIGKQKPPFVIISDPDFDLYKLASIQNSFVGKLKAMFRFGSLISIFKNNFFSLKSLTRANTLPADFLVNRHGIVEKAYYGKDFGDHIETEEIIAWIKSTSKAPFSSLRSAELA